MTAGRLAQRLAKWLSHCFVRHALSQSAGDGCVRYLQAREAGSPTMGPMKILNLLHVVCAQAFYRWAMKEISPMHPDVPKIMVRQHQLAEKYRRVWG